MSKVPCTPPWSHPVQTLIGSITSYQSSYSDWLTLLQSLFPLDHYYPSLLEFSFYGSAWKITLLGFPRPSQLHITSCNALVNLALTKHSLAISDFTSSIYPTFNTKLNHFLSEVSRASVFVYTILFMRAFPASRPPYQYIQVLPIFQDPDQIPTPLWGLFQVSDPVRCDFCLLKWLES